MKFKKRLITHTNGKGFWSREKREVHIKEALVNFMADYGDGPHGELIAKFTKKTWNIYEHGLIYTDDLWIKEFRKQLVGLGLSEAAAKDCSYSEQGMQGEDYVSMDVGSKFLKEWLQHV